MASEEQGRLVAFLRWTERFTKTDMVYLAESALWTNLSVGATSLLAFVISIAFANLVPKEQFGIYQYLLSLATIIGALTMTGMNSAVTQAVARGYDGVLESSVRLQLKLAAIPFIAGALMAGYYALNGNILIAIGVLLVAMLTPVANAFNTYAAYLNGKHDFRGIFFGATLTNALYYGSILLAIIIEPNAFALITVNLCVNTGIAAWLYFRTLRLYQPGDTDDPTALSYGTHLSLMNMLDIFVTQADAVLIFHFLGAVPLAIYNFACAIPERIGGLFKFLVYAGPPKFAQSTPRELAPLLIGKTIRAMLAGLLVALLYIAFAPLLFHLLFPKYLDSLPYTQVYALIIVLTAGSMPITALISQRLKTELYIFKIVGPLLHFVLQVSFLITWGLMGILVARLLSNLINIGLALLLFFMRAWRTE
jgi:O-antigen/teichoic acid export membrane protein